jgi:glycosyltransferase involved in cell wall biosynthesis
LTNFLLISYEYPPYGGGGGRAMSFIAQELVRTGHEVTVLTGGGCKARDLEPRDSGVAIVRVGSARKKQDSATIFEMLSFCIHSMPYILCSDRKKTTAIIAFFLFPTGPIALALKLRWGIPYVISLRGGDVPGNEPRLNRLHQFLYLARRAIYKNAKHVVANSQDLANTARKYDNIAIEIIPNGIDTKFFCQDRSLESACKRPGKQINFLFIGRFQRQKRVPELLKELIRIRKVHNLDFVLTLVGDGPDKLVIDHQIRRLQNSSWIHRAGWQDGIRVREFYWRADCLLNLSSYEGLPNTVMEAMACGVAVIASDIGPHRDLIKEGETGFLVSPEDFETLEKRIVLCSSNRCLLGKIGNNARQKIKEKMNWAQVAGAYEKLAIGSLTR